MERLNNFLKELSELTIKYGIAISGCGCCGSPYINDFKKEYDGEDLWFDKQKNGYVLENIQVSKNDTL